MRPSQPTTCRIFAPPHVVLGPTFGASCIISLVLLFPFPSQWTNRRTPRCKSTVGPTPNAICPTGSTRCADKKKYCVHRVYEIYQSIFKLIFLGVRCVHALSLLINIGLVRPDYLALALSVGYEQDVRTYVTKLVSVYVGLINT